ncbi:MAG TPA: cyclic nucleotide-binding domain-containing protein [Burkholderiales bacterium]|nr:cyclic nucleotide-binding domain-containing protein [Burkholderiales bacterium]
MLGELKAVSLFQAVAEEPLRALAERARRRQLAGGELVFKEGASAESLYVVIQGKVKIFLTEPSGTEVVLDTKGPGQYFGEMMLDHRPRSASVMTLEPSHFIVISHDDFRRFLRAHPEAAEQVILNLIRIARGMNERTREGVTVGQRLRHYIEWLEAMKAPDLPMVRRWMLAKRWVLIGLLTLAVAQYYFMDVFLEISKLGGITVFGGRG